MASTKTKSATSRKTIKSPSRTGKTRRADWKKQDVQRLHSLARQGVSARQIGRQLGRTEGAIRQKAYAEHISFKAAAAARSKISRKTATPAKRPRSKKAGAPAA